MENFIFIICHILMASCGIVLIGIGMRFRSERQVVAREKKVKTVPRKAPVQRVMIEEDIDRSLRFPANARVSI